MSRGTFIAFEGIDGCGKTTAISHFAERMKKLGRSVLITHEPTDGKIGGKIYDILYGRLPMIPLLELQKLYVEDRKDHIRNVIEPAILRGEMVLCDRYWLSTLAFGMSSCSMEELIGIHSQILGIDFLKPDLTLLIDVPVKMAMARLGKAARGLDYFEKEEKQESIRQNYLSLLKEKKLGRIRAISGEKDPIGVVNDITEAVAAAEL